LFGRGLNNTSSLIVATVALMASVFSIDSFTAFGRTAGTLLSQRREVRITRFLCGHLPALTFCNQKTLPSLGIPRITFRTPRHLYF
jgi:hypothetical protein